jgi:predicted HD phosphohydrolase
MDGFTPKPPARPPLLHADFRYAEKPALAAMDGTDWQTIEAQRPAFMHGRQAREVLALFETARADPSFGYVISMYDHGLQAATMALQAGRDEEFVVVCLLHDIGFTIAGPSHGEFSAALLRPYVSERNRWVLEMHQLFTGHHAHDHPTLDGHEADRFLGHPYFADAADFVARFDQNAIDPTVPVFPIEAFAPMVHRLFARPPSRRFAP